MFYNIKNNKIFVIKFLNAFYLALSLFKWHLKYFCKLITVRYIILINNNAYKYTELAASRLDSELSGQIKKLCTV